MKALTLAFALAPVMLTSGAAAVSSVHEISKATGRQYCGRNAELNVSIVAPRGAHGTLRVTPVAAPKLAQQVSYTGNGKSVTVPVTIAGLGCSDVRGIKLTLDDGRPAPTWLMPKQKAYGVAQRGHSTTTHIERVEATTTTGANTQFEILLLGGTDGRNLRGNIRVRSVHSDASPPTERTTTYDVERGKGKVHTFGHSFANNHSLTAFHVYLNGASQPLVAKRLVVGYGL